MSWSKKTEEALQKWLAPDTAYDGNPHDDTRFYEFVFYVWLDVCGIWDEALARQKMRQKAMELHPQWHPDTIDSLVERRISEGTLILDFLLNTKAKGLIT